MENNYSITIPHELLERCMKMVKCRIDIVDMKAIAEMLAQWGADQELEACCAELPYNLEMKVRAARRPEPPSLQELALAVLNEGSNYFDGAQKGIIRRALEEALDDN